MLYVNHYRPLASQPEDSAVLLAEIEAVSRLKATGIVNNSHLMKDTTRQTILTPLNMRRRPREGLVFRLK